MISSILLLILSAGIPYYIPLEKNGKFSSKQIFLLSSALLLCAIVLSRFVSGEPVAALVILSLASALFSIYRATKTTNFYKLGYYLIFVNAPFFVLFGDEAAVYSFSLLIALLGIYLVAAFYEKHYGSANYQNITGITLVTPCVGTFLTLYLIALALYPPFPNALFFLGALFNSQPDPLWYFTVIILFFGNFFLAMRVMKTTLFGRPNSNIHYSRMNGKEKATHAAIVMTLLIFSLFGLKEILL